VLSVVVFCTGWLSCGAGAAAGASESLGASDFCSDFVDLSQDSGGISVTCV